MITDIDNLHDNIEYTTDLSPIEIIYGDFSVTAKISAYIQIYKDNKDKFEELILHLCSQYSITKTSTSHDILLALCQSKQILFDTKCMMYYVVKNRLHDKSIYLSCINSLIKDNNIYFTLLIDICEDALKNNMLISLVKQKLTFVTNDSKIECKKRYNTIKNLKYNENIRKELFVLFFDNKQNELYYRILSSAVIYSESVEEELFKISNNETVEYSLRAESADIITINGSDDSKKKARTILYSMGKSKNKPDNIYTHGENVHNNNIMKNVNNMILKLKEEEVKKIYDMETIISQITKRDDCNDKILKAINRIIEDNTIYNGMMLVDIFIKIYSIIQDMNKVNKETYSKRLLQEMEDMANTCTSGHISRLINTLSGYNTYSISIGLEDQIIAILHNKLNKLLMNDKKQVEIVSQMILDDEHEEYGEYEADNSDYSIFLGDAIQIAKDELKVQFEGQLSDDSFEEIIRLGIIKYRGFNVNI